MTAIIGTTGSPTGSPTGALSADALTGSPPSGFRQMVPPALSFVSGFVDTVGFLGLFGLLTSQVTGSFVAAGASFVHKEPGLIAKLLAIPMFMAGAALMTLLVAILTRYKVKPLPWALASIAALVAGFLAAAVSGQPFGNLDAPAALIAAVMAFLAMGAESALVRTLFKGSVPANFMTGNVTQVAVEATDMTLARFRLLFDGDEAANGARATAAYKQLGVLIPMITGFVLGCVIAAHTFLAIGFWSLVIATGIASTAAIIVGIRGE
ncbi:MAG: DUF1275 domain-containing protein [Hyphomicrobiaceae bacterium]|nr:DUF1275 domain-containing protein [Hyphomicrobiaceae bacterium]